MLYREPKLLKAVRTTPRGFPSTVSVLYREPKLLKVRNSPSPMGSSIVSVLYREPKLLKEVIRKEGDTKNIVFQCSTVSRNC